MLCRHRAARVAVLAFRRSEDAFGKARGTEEHFANPRNFDNVYTNGNNHD